jgi:integrase
MIFSPWTVDPLKILTRQELAKVLADLADRASRSPSHQMNRVIFRLACCCGLRVSEITALRVGDVCLGVCRPHLKIRPDGAKGNKPRIVPVW